MEPVVILIYVVNGGIIIIHCVCLSLLCSKSHLRQGQFIGLVMCLSISDIVTGIGACYTAFLGKTIYNTENRIHCLLMFNFVGRGSMIFSIFQRVQICMEQLNATFVTKRTVLTALASYKATFVGLGVTFLSTIIWFIVDSFVLSTPCDRNYASSLEYFASRDIPGLILLSTIIGSYSVIVFRVMRHGQLQKRLRQHEGEKPRRNEHVRIMIRRMITLLIIVGFTVLSYLPRMLFVSSKVVSRDELTQSTFSVFTVLSLMAFINPLVDPFIYIFRLEKVREQFKPGCCRRNQEEG